MAGISLPNRGLNDRGTDRTQETERASVEGHRSRIARQRSGPWSNRPPKVEGVHRHLAGQSCATSAAIRSNAAATSGAINRWKSPCTCYYSCPLSYLDLAPGAVRRLACRRSRHHARRRTPTAPAAPAAAR